MHSSTLHSGDGNTKQWPDFYSILDSSPETDGETLRRSINTLYIKANEQSDHRELNTRFYNQVLTQKVLPQCRQILLNDQARQAYNQQWYLHRDGAVDALSYQDFITKISKDAGTARTLLLSDDEISILPSIGVSPSTSPLSALKNPGQTTAKVIPSAETNHLPSTDSAEPTEVFEGEEVIEQPETALVASHTSQNAKSFVMAPAPSPSEAGKKGIPIIAALAGLLVFGIGGFLWNSSRQAQQVDAPNPLAGNLQALALQKRAQQEPAPAPAEPLDHPLLRLKTLALNADFETGKISPWVPSNKQVYVEAAPLRDAKSGSNIMTFWDTVPYEARVKQTIHGLQPGKYTLRAWIQRTGEQQRAEMFVEAYGGPTRTLNLPNENAWVLATIRDIEVKIDQCTIGFAAKAPAFKHVQVDGVEFFRQ